MNAHLDSSLNKSLGDASKRNTEGKRREFGVKAKRRYVREGAEENREGGGVIGSVQNEERGGVV